MFIWIQNFKNIKNLQCNFGGDHKYTFSNAEHLYCSFNEKHISGFFNLNDEFKRANLKNVTGIVGENGTGKSSILEFLLRVFSGSINSSHPDTRYFVIYAVKDKYYYQCNLEKSFLIIEGKIQDISNSFRMNNTDYQNQSLGSSNSIIFFSNIYDARAADKINKYANAGTKIINLSTNYISTKYNESFTDSLRSDFTKQFIFLKEYEERILTNTGLNIPENITISMNDFGEINDGEVEYSSTENYGYYNIISDIDDEFTEILVNMNFNSFEIAFQKHLLMSFFSDLLFEISKMDVGTFIRNSLREEIEDTSHELFYQYNPEKNHSIYIILKKILFDKLDDINTVKSIEDDITDLITQLKEKTSLFINSRLKLEKHFNKIYDDSLFDKGSLKLRTNHPSIKEFVRLYNTTTPNYSYINFFWSELSSGEHALLNLFGRFYSVSRDSTENILILIDEGDLYFHPQWQKEWFMLFINLISQMFVGREIHIILTTHSPFVLSDLPGNNVIFLKKDLEGNTIVGKGLDEKIETFASNIHTLLMDSFFIKNGLCGTFAKYKINKLIDFILNSNVELLKSKNHTIQKEIETIGEPLVKKKIISILQDRIGTDVINIDSKIARLQEQIDELRKMKR
ncbi:AAA family ATPase [Rossellomorea sp. NPDC071047]|uniref:AAA family ATPase n=1 Tax=Rossellomorea sp. NPDC071047 TaxID=3390675 RepID=UPI003D0350C4